MRLFASCMNQLKIPRIWRRALILSIPESDKLLDDRKSYCPISLPCTPFKILERLIYARVEPIIGTISPRNKAGFPRGSSVDQVTLLTQLIEDSFLANTKAGSNKRSRLRRQELRHTGIRLGTSSFQHLHL